MTKVQGRPGPSHQGPCPSSSRAVRRPVAGHGRCLDGWATGKLLRFKISLRNGTGDGTAVDGRRRWATVCLPPIFISYLKELFIASMVPVWTSDESDIFALQS